AHVAAWGTGVALIVVTHEVVVDPVTRVRRDRQEWQSERQDPGGVARRLIVVQPDRRAVLDLEPAYIAGRDVVVDPHVVGLADIDPSVICPRGAPVVD